MIKDTNQTEVIFRKYRDGEIIALFPYMPEMQRATCLSYMKIGQHGVADLHLISATKPVDSDEYQDLFIELENQGYKLKMIKRMSWKKYNRVYIGLNMLKARSVK